MTAKCPKCQVENPKTDKFCLDCGTPLPAAKAAPPELTETSTRRSAPLEEGSFPVDVETLIDIS